MLFDCMIKIDTLILCAYRTTANTVSHIHYSCVLSHNFPGLYRISFDFVCIFWFF